MQKCFVVVLLAALLPGCASMTKDPLLKDRLTYPSRQELADKQQVQQLSYLGQALLSAEDRARMKAELSQQEWVKREYDALVGAGVAKSLGVNPFTIEGSNIAGMTMIAMDVASLFLPDGSMDRVSQMFLPGKFEGVEITDGAVALRMAWQHTERQLDKAGQATGRRITCIWQCQSMDLRLYELTRLQTNPGYIYDPENIYVLVDGGELKRAQPDPLRDVALGYPVKWSTDLGNTWGISFWGVVERDAKGAVTDFVGEKTKRRFPNASDRVSDISLARAIRQALTDDGGHLFLADAKDYPAMVSFKGRLYSFLSRHSRGFIEFSLSEPKS